MIKLEYIKGNDFDRLNISEDILNQELNIGEKEIVRGGALTTAALLFVLNWSCRKYIEKFGEGFLNVEKAKEMGESLRIELLEDIEWLTKQIKQIIEKIGNNHTNIVNLENEDYGYKIITPLNSTDLNEILCNRLGEAIISLKSILSTINISYKHPKIIQLIPDPRSNTWSYALIPSNKKLGKYCDYYINIKTAELLKINSVDEFKIIFNIHNDSELKKYIGFNESY